MRISALFGSRETSTIFQAHPLLLLKAKDKKRTAMQSSDKREVLTGVKGSFKVKDCRKRVRGESPAKSFFLIFAWQAPSIISSRGR
jgi:hypothetical protein